MICEIDFEIKMNFEFEWILNLNWAFVMKLNFEIKMNFEIEMNFKTEMIDYINCIKSGSNLRWNIQIFTVLALIFP